MPSIVVLDGYTTIPTDADGENAGVSWEPLAACGELEIYDRTSAEETAERIGDAKIVLTNKTPIDAAVFEACPQLKYVGVLATGVNVVDLDAAKAHGVTVTNIPGYSTPSVAQHVFAMLLELCNRTAEHDRAVHEGRWADCADFSFTTGPLVELHGRTLGIVGMGSIGQATARVGHALGMSIAAHSRTEKELDYPVRWLGVDELFAEADVVSLHCPLTPRTERHVNAERLATMKPTSYLINTGRGALIDEPALAAALHAGTIAGAGLDVLSSEPPAADNPLLSAPNCIITPHVAWATIESRKRLVQIAADNVRGFLDGQPINVVSSS
jgi:glycerate dehydrogenase